MGAYSRMELEFGDNMGAPRCVPDKIDQNENNKHCYNNNTGDNGQVLFNPVLPG